MKFGRLLGAMAVAASLSGTIADKSKNHRCHNDGDCLVKCAKGLYYQAENEETGLDELRCEYYHTDYVYIAVSCASASHPFPTVHEERNAHACKSVGGLLCNPEDKSQVNPKLYQRCIIGLPDLYAFMEFCSVGQWRSHLIEGPRDIAWDCKPDYSP